MPQMDSFESITYKCFGTPLLVFCLEAHLSMRFPKGNKDARREKKICLALEGSRETQLASCITKESAAND